MTCYDVLYSFSGSALSPPRHQGPLEDLTSSNYRQLFLYFFFQPKMVEGGEEIDLVADMLAMPFRDGPFMKSWIL